MNVVDPPNFDIWDRSVTWVIIYGKVFIEELIEHDFIVINKTRAIAKGAVLGCRSTMRSDFSKTIAFI